MEVDSKPNAPVIEVVVIDDHAMLRELITEALDAEPGIRVLGQGASAQEALQLCATMKPHVLVLDMIMPGQQGASIVGEIRNVSPRTRVLVFSGVTSPVSIRIALGAGARGFLPKSASFAELVAGIRELHAERYFFGQGTQQLIAGVLAGGGRTERHLNLTAKEHSILAQIAQGRSSKEIAAALGRSVYTIENRRRRLMDKTGVHTVAGLTLLALELGLLQAVMPANAAPPQTDD